MNRQPHLPFDGKPLGGMARSPLTLLHLAIVILCALGFAIDILEVALGSALSAIFAAPPYNLAGIHLSSLVSAVYVGAIIGAPILGSVADRIGPKRTLTGLLGWLALTSLLAAFSTSAGSLTIWRLLSGVALGAYPPLTIAYLTSIAPARRRGTLIFAVCAFAYLAPPAAIFSVRWLTPIHPLGIEGWRWPLLAGGVGCVVAGLGMIGVPEAPDWLDSRARFAAADAVRQRFARSWRLPSGPPRSYGPMEPQTLPESQTAAQSSLPKARLAFVSLLYFLVPWATVSFPLLSGPLLLARHFNLSDTLLYVGLSTFGPVVATFLSGLVVDRFRREIVLAGCALGMLIAMLLFFSVTAGPVMASGMILFGIGSALYMPTMVMFGSEAFTASVRGRAASIGWACNRLGAAISPILLIPLVHGGREGLIAVILCGTQSLIVLLLGWRMRRDTPVQNGLEPGLT